MISAFVLAQVILIPILGGMWMGIKREREEYKKLVRIACLYSRRRR